MTEETDIIQHLVEIEAEASEMLLAAQKEADSQVAKARAQSEEIFKDRYGKFASDLEFKENQTKQNILSKHESDISEYKNSINSEVKDYDAFYSLLKESLAD